MGNNARWRRGILLSVWMWSLTAIDAHAAEYKWQQLPPIPDAAGVAGPFAGVSNDALLVAGGANFPAAKPWEGGTKVWHDVVYVLESPAEEWKVAGRLEHPLAYGVSITTSDGVLCLGGSNSQQHFADCFLLQWRAGELRRIDYPALPQPCANMCGVLLGHEVYVCGGSTTPDSVVAETTLWKLDLKQLKRGWQALAPLPGDGRILAAAGAQSGAIYIFGGAALHEGADGKPARTYLQDGYQFTPQSGWSRTTDLLRPSVAAPSPAPAIGVSHLLLLGGDDGSQLATAPTEHRGFPRHVSGYDTVTNTWVDLTEFPESASPTVTVPVVNWHQQFVIPSGEIRPGIRTPQVLSLAVQPTQARFGVINWIVVGTYLSGMIGVGWWFMRREAASTTDGYFRGGQQIPGWVAGLSIFATMLSSLTFMGIPARAYRTDLSWYIGQLPVLIVIPLVIYFYLPFFRGLNITSAYEYLERRFSIHVRLFASVSFILYHIGRIAIVLYLPALALAAVSDIGVMPAILLIGVLCLVYTVMGGITAVVWTDAVQAIVLMLGAVMCLAIAIYQVDGGLAGITEVARQDHKLFHRLNWASLSYRDGTDSAAIIFIAFLFNALVPYTSGQDVVQRYVTTKDIDTARRSLWLTMWLSILGSLIFFLLGTVIYAFYKTHPEALEPPLADGDSILPFYIMQQLPVGLSGLVIAAIFAASQSTISSSLNSIAAAWVTDIDARLLRPGRSDATYLAAARNVVVLFGILGIGVACWMAATHIDSAFKTFNTLIGLTAGSLGGLFALGVFTRRANATGALGGAIAGLAAVLYIKFAQVPITGLLNAAIGCCVCFAVGYLMSLCCGGSPSLIDCETGSFIPETARDSNTA